MAIKLDEKLEKAMQVIEQLRREIYDAKRLEDLELIIVELRKEVEILKSNQPRDIGDIVQ